MKASKHQLRAAVKVHKKKLAKQTALIQQLQHQLRFYENLPCNEADREEVWQAVSHKAALIDSINELILVFDDELRYREVYAPQDENLVMPAHELVGKTIEESGIKEPTYTLVKKALEDTLRNDSTSIVEYWIDLPVGRKWFESRITPLCFPDGSHKGALSVVRDITPRKQMEMFIRESEEKYHSVVKSANVGIWAHDTVTRKEIYSLEYATLLGYGPDDFTVENGYIQDQLWDILTHPDDLQSSKVIIDAYIEEGCPGIIETELRMRRKDGSWAIVLTRGQALRDLEGRATNTIHGIHIDITERKQMEETLRREKKRAEASDRAKSQFLSNMSHELRTPLNGLMGMTQLLQMTPLNEEQEAFVEASLTSCAAMTNVINDILNYTCLDWGFESAVIKPLNLKTLIDEVRELHFSASLNKGLDLRYDFSPHVPNRMIGDAHKIKQILNNLVGNAIKFTSVGHVFLEVSLADHAPSDEKKNNQVWVTFKVKDTGIGIPKEMQQAIFHRFNQVDNSHRRNFGGVGLGLTIAQELAHTIDGVIEVESTLNEGSCFSLSCPLTPVSLMPEDVDVGESKGAGKFRSRASTDEIMPPLQKNILVVDDDAFSLLAMEKVMAKLGYNVTTATHGQEAVDLVESGGSHFHVIFMDLQMPVLDGWDATQRIRNVQQHQSERSLIVALTGAVLPESQKRCAEVGMDDFLAKPVSMDLLVEKLDGWFNLLTVSQ